jgi:Virulence-associated protein E
MAGRAMTADEIILDNFAHLPVWVGWREEQRNGKKTKVPYSPRTGWEAKSNNAETWATRGEAETWAIANRGSGVGIVLSRINGGDCCLCGIDLDTCRDPTTETLQGWAQEVVDRFKTYTEVSPSGTGVKCFFMHASADTPAVERLFGGKTGKQFKNGGGEHCSAIEIYRTSHYFTVTSESVGPTDILRQVPLADLEWLVLDAGPRFAHKENQKSRSSGNDQSRSGKAFRKGAALKAAGHSYAAMRDALLADADHEISEWARTKSLANGERELHRIYENAKAALSPDFIRGDEKQILRGHPDNIRMAIEHLGVSLRQNEFSNMTEIHGLAGYGPELTDAGAIRLRFLIGSTYYFLPPVDLFQDVLTDIAHLNKYHPVRDFLDNIKWDMNPRIDNWLHDYAGAEDTPFNRAIGRIFLIAAVRRVRQPGIKFDTMLVFESPIQGKNKSSAMRLLAMREEWFTDNLPLGVDPKEVIEQISGIWIVEFAELDGMATRERERITAFPSRQVDKARPAYGRRRETVKPRCVPQADSPAHSIPGHGRPPH